MSELHPIFEDIFKGIVSDNKKTIVLSSETTALLVEIIDEDDFDTLELLRDFINEIKSNSQGVITEIDKKCDAIEEHLIKKGICPLCGGVLEFEHDENLDTYVPYGNTQVLETRGGILKCDNCGYRSDK